MPNKKPQTIYADQTSALLKSIPNIFQDDESDFDYNWDQMMKNCFNGRPTSDFKWLVQTHGNHIHWSPAWVKSHFTAGLKTTQLSESFNAFLHGFLQPDHSLVQFFSHFNMMVQRMRDNHYDLSFKYYYEEDTTKGSDLNKFFKVFTIEKIDDPDEVDDDADNDNGAPSNFDVLYEEFQENMFLNFEDHDRLDERVVIVDIRSKSFSSTCRMFENRGFLCRRVFKTIPGQYVLKRWTRDVRSSVDKLKSTISVGTEDTTQAQ
ncbi:hypothetical protein TSUD_91310 [Trifolium subterraneum]|uniref:Protein FAR1-RELATED SEQUENCE n=1 Tax=Trifolium subterraneum TaxID=3900 RepID=A0A2Z6NK99_TRISU|nr:hypothetical protein TSUD_91310 [Trifolium subterraneum]